MSTRYAKQKRWRARQRLKGCCPHCGKPCAPYAECAAVRAKRRTSTKAREARVRGRYATNPAGQLPRASRAQHDGSGLAPCSPGCAACARERLEIEYRTRAAL